MKEVHPSWPRIAALFRNFENVLLRGCVKNQLLREKGLLPLDAPTTKPKKRGRKKKNWNYWHIFCFYILSWFVLNENEENWKLFNHIFVNNLYIFSSSFICFCVAWLSLLNSNDRSHQKLVSSNFELKICHILSHSKYDQNNE